MLSDFMSHLKLDIFPTVGMVIFLIVFLAITVRVLFASKTEMQEAARVPLNDEPNASNGVEQ